LKLNIQMRKQLSFFTLLFDVPFCGVASGAEHSNATRLWLPDHCGQSGA